MIENFTFCSRSQCLLHPCRALSVKKSLSVMLHQALVAICSITIALSNGYKSKFLFFVLYVNTSSLTLISSYTTAFTSIVTGSTTYRYIYAQYRRYTVSQCPARKNCFQTDIVLINIMINHWQSFRFILVAIVHNYINHKIRMVLHLTNLFNLKVCHLPSMPCKSYLG